MDPLEASGGFLEVPGPQLKPTAISYTRATQERRYFSKSDCKSNVFTDDSLQHFLNILVPSLISCNWFVALTVCVWIYSRLPWNCCQNVTLFRRAFTHSVTLTNLRQTLWSVRLNRPIYGRTSALNTASARTIHLITPESNYTNIILSVSQEKCSWYNSFRIKS